jgi:hypothetical protein
LELRPINPFCHISIPLNTLKKSLSNFSDSSCLFKYTLQVNLGSVPPFPSGTSSSQNFAIWNNLYLSISDKSKSGSINLPIPYLLCVNKSKNIQTGLSV